MVAIKEVVAHAMALHKKGDEDGAAAVFEKLLKASPDEPLALEYLGVRAIKKRDYKTAITLLRQAVAQPGCRPSVRFQLGHALRDSGQLVDASDAYRRYVADSSDPAGAVTLADVLIDLDRGQEAETVLRQAVEWKPDYVKALCLLAKVCVARAKPSDAEEFRTRAVESEEDGKLTRLMKAAAHLDMGVPVIIASGDPKYVARFAPNLIKSVAANSSGADIHIHVVVPDESSAPPDLPADLPTHTLTWENVPGANRATFSSRRFIRAATFMRAIDRTLLIIDIDSSFKKDIAAATTELPKHDVAMRYREEEIFLNQRVAAGFLALSPTKAAQTFIDCVAAYIRHFERTEKAAWFIDQIALLAARCHFQPEDGDPDVIVTDVPERFLDWRRHASDSVIWTTKGAGKVLPK
jgi:tetratricopeptide (TPR) repeat protein